MANDKQGKWVTVHGTHIFVEKGQSRQQAINNAIAKDNEDKKAKQIAKNKEQADRLNGKSVDGGGNGKSNTESEMKSLQEGGRVDLFNRPQISTDHLKNAGWDDAGEGTATVFTSTYSNEDGTKAINVTPIKIKDGQVYVLSPQQLEDYANRLLEGEEDKDGLQIGSIVEGERAVEKADKIAQRVHEFQEDYYMKKKK